MMAWLSACHVGHMTSPNDRTVLPLLSAMDGCAPALLGAPVCQGDSHRQCYNKITVMIYNYKTNTKNSSSTSTSTYKRLDIIIPILHYSCRKLSTSNSSWPGRFCWNKTANKKISSPPASTKKHPQPWLKSMSARSICFFSTASTKAVLPACDLGGAPRRWMISPSPGLVLQPKETREIWGWWRCIDIHLQL